MLRRGLNLTRTQPTLGGDSEATVCLAVTGEYSPDSDLIVSQMPVSRWLTCTLRNQELSSGWFWQRSGWAQRQKEDEQEGPWDFFVPGSQNQKQQQNKTQPTKSENPNKIKVVQTFVSLAWAVQPGSLFYQVIYLDWIWEGRIWSSFIFTYCPKVGTRIYFPQEDSNNSTSFVWLQK